MTGLPTGWAVANIGSLCDLVNGMAFKPTDWTTEGLKIVRIQNLNNPAAPYNRYNGVLRNRFIIDNGDLLFAWSGTPGTSFGAHIWRGERAVLNQHIFRVDFDQSVLNKSFFRLAINQKLSQLIGKAHGGAGLQHVTKGRFEETLIEVPPLSEQHRIVARIEELFSELDASVESLTRARALLGLYRQSLLKAAFQGKLTADWRAANPDKLENPETLLSRIRKERETSYARALDDWQTALSEWRNNGEKGRKPQKPDRPPELVVTDSLDDAIPEGWVTVLVAGLMRGPLSNGRSVKDRTGGFPVLRLTAFRRGRLDLREFKEGAWTAEEAEPWAVQENDFFVVRGNGSKHLVGIGALAQGVSTPVAYPDTMIRLPADPAYVDPAYFLLLWNSRVVRDQIEVAARTTAGIYKINQPHIEGFRVPFPPMGEQRLIVERLEAVLSQVDQQESEITTALIRIAALRQSILKRAFSGHLVAQDPSDEPASALLARLQSQTPTTPARSKRRA